MSESGENLLVGCGRFFLRVQTVVPPVAKLNPIEKATLFNCNGENGQFTV